jgi:nitroreductase
MARDMFNDLTSPASLLASRRSGKPRDMIDPGPSPDELDAMLGTAMRVPDHGKLAPWRFVIVGADQRDALSELLTRSYRAAKPDAGRLELEAMDQFARQAPSLVVVLSTPAQASKIPLWEQQLSAGAACMQLLNAVHAKGYVAGWLTGWAAYDATVCRDFGGSEGDCIAGFIFIGSPGRDLEERPRPDPGQIASHWRPRSC